MNLTTRLARQNAKDRKDVYHWSRTLTRLQRFAMAAGVSAEKTVQIAFVRAHIEQEVWNV